MQIQTLFHNANFLKKSTPKADARARALKAGRRFVCVLLLLVVCMGAVWGAQYRLKDSTSTSEQSWNNKDIWAYSALGISWGTASNPPTGSDRVYLQGSSGVVTVIKLTSNISVDQLIINSDNASGGTIKLVADTGVTITVNDKLCLGLPDSGGTVNLILENVSLDCSSLEVNDDVNSHNKNDGNLVISGTGTAGITADTVNVFADKAGSPGAMSVDFGNVPLTAGSINVNSDQKTGGVTIETDSTIDAGTVTIGGSNPGSTNTTFGGTGTIDVDAWGGNSSSAPVTINTGLAVPNAPTDPYTYTVTVGSFDDFCTDSSHNEVDVVITAKKSTPIDPGTEWQLELPFSLSQSGTRFVFDDKTGDGSFIMYTPQNDTYSITLKLKCYDISQLQDGDGFTLKLYSKENVLLKTVSWQYATPDAYNLTVDDRYDTFTGSGDTNEFLVTITSTVPGSRITYTFVSETGSATSKFTLNGLSNDDGYATFNSAPYKKEWPVKAVAALEEGEGFIFTVFRPDGSELGSVSWFKPYITWTGAVSSAWDNLSNWSGITDLSELTGKNITITDTYTNPPEISSSVTVKSLTIKNGASVTQSGGTLTVESLVCEGTGSFTASAGGVVFDGATCSFSDASERSVFNNVSLAGSATLTLSSPLHLSGNLDVSAGVLTQGTNGIIFEGTGTQSVTASGFPFGTLSFAGSGGSGNIRLLSDVICSTCTVESGVTVEGNGKMLNVTGVLTNKGTIINSGAMLYCNSYVPASDASDVVSVSGTVTLVTNGGTVSKIQVMDTATISGSVSCAKFDATNLGGKTLTINGQLIVGNDLILSGSSASSKLEIAGGGMIKLNASQIGGQYLNITGSLEVHDMSDGTSVVYTATDSVGSASPAVLPQGWNVCSGDLVYIWKGGDGSTDAEKTAWTRPGNWSTGLAPSATGADVEIPSGLTIYPVSPSSELSINSLKVESGASVSVADGTKLRFVSYSGNGVIKLGTGNIEIRSAGTNCTIQNIEFTGTGTRDFADISKVTLVNVKVPSNKTLQLTGNLTLTGTLSNAGTVNTNGSTLTFGAYADPSASATGLIQIAGNNALALYSGGTGGTINNLEFTGTAEFKNMSGLTFSNVTVDSGAELKLTGALSVSGVLDNREKVNLNSHELQFASYSHVGTVTDTIVTNGGKLTATGTGTAGGSISVVEIGGDLTVTNNGTALKIDVTTITNDKKLTVGSGSGSTPVFSNIIVNPGKTLTLGSALTAGTITNKGIIALAGNNLSWTVAYNGLADGTDEISASGTVSIGPSGSGTETIGIFKVTDTAIVSGTFSCKKFVATNLGGKTLTVNGTLSVGSGTAMDTLQLSGATGNPLSVNGNGIIKLNASQTGGVYLSVSTSGPSIRDLSGNEECIYTATYSTASGGTATEFKGWNICSGDLVYIWKGGDGSSDAEKTAWFRPKNWTVRIVPGAGCDVEIPATASYDVVVSSAVTVRSVSLGSSRQLTLGGDLSVTGAFTNSGTIDMNGKTLTFATYTDSAGSVVKLGASGTIQPTGAGVTVRKLVFTGSRYFSDIANLSVTDAEIPSSVTITQNGNLSVTGALTNNGTIDMQNYDLTCGSYADTSGAAETGGLIKLGTGTLSPGSGGTLRNIEFAATRSFSDISGLTITKAKINAGVAVSLSGGFTVAGILDNNGTVNIGASALQFAQYSHSENTGTDTLTISGGSITSTGNGTGMINVNRFFLNGNATVTNNGTGALRFNTATAAADAVLTANGSGASPVFDNLVAGADASDTAKLTLASDITAGNVIINASATLDADSRGLTPVADSGSSAHGCTTFGAGYVLTVSGNFINNSTGHSVSNPYPGFIAQNGRVEITGSGTSHKISGNNKFHDFVCVTPGAELIFDANKTTNVDHQIWICGTGSNLITMTTNATEGEKWTLDVIWDVAAGTPEHRKPVLKYVAPHKSISYSAILKGCLDNCIDDASDLRDSTNVNWFDDMPTILMTLAPVGGRQLFVMFSTEVSAAPGTDLRNAIALTSASVSNLIDAAVPVTLYTGSSDKSKTAVVFGLTRDLTWNDLYGSDCLHVEIAQTSAVRVGTTRISYQQGVCHCTSDFAVNAARMLFGYDNFIDSATPLTIEKGTNSVRTWDQSDPVSNRLHAESDLLFQAQFDATVPDGTKLVMLALTQAQLDESVIGNNYRSYYDLSTRLWLPDFFQPLSSAGQTVPSAQHIAQDSTSSGRLRNYSLQYNASSSYPLFKMTDGEEIQFLFKVKNPDGTDLMIDHDYDDNNGVYTPTPKRPVYAIRLVDDNDITSFDLWSVMLQSTTMQRGNVTILNNVINADKREQTFVTVDVKKAGSLTVQVLTLDGSVITTLQRGRKQPGTYGYDWDGTNGKGKPVARGMYFIRVIGPDIDETRKVMVVRD